MWSLPAFVRRMLLSALMLVLMSASLLACQATPRQTAGPSPAGSATPLPQVKKGSANLVSAEAIVVPYKKADLGFRSSGRVVEILVTEGQTAKAGQELARLDTRDAKQQVAKAEAVLKEAQAALAKVKAGAQAEEIAAAEAGVEIAKAKAAAAEAEVKRAEGILAANRALASSAASVTKAAEMQISSEKGILAGAEASLRSAEATLNRALAGPTEIEIAIANKQIDLERNQLWGLRGARDAASRDIPGARESAEAQVAAAEARVDIATLRLQELKAGVRAEDIEVYRARVVQAQADIQTANARVALAEADVETNKAQQLQAQANVQTQEAQLVASRAGLDSAKAEARKSQAEYERLKAGSRAEDIAAAEAKVAQVEAALQEAKNVLEDAVLRAPFDGTVGAVLLQAGELVNVPMTAIRLGDLTRFYVQTEDLGEADAYSVRTGQEATVRVDALGDKTLKAKVKSIAPAAIDRRGDKVFTVTLELQGDLPEGLLWGMTAFVEIGVR